ncbi:MAG: hypothetical protein ACK58L_19570 [Planctomycetota bacterium]
MRIGGWKRWLLNVSVLSVGFSTVPQLVHAEDLRDAAPPGAFMAAYGKQNPERDYQKDHYKIVWEEIQKAKPHEKLLQLVQSTMSESDAEAFIAARDALQNAVAPIEIEKLLNASEMLYAQKFEGPTSLQLFLVRVPDGGAESLKQGIVNLMKLATGAAEGQLPVTSQTVAGVEMTYLRFPSEMPITFQPAVGVKGDIVVLTTSVQMAEESLKLLADPSAESKFDDPRVIAALKHLPAPEDGLVFIDGKALIEQMRGIPNFINAASNGDATAARVTSVMSKMLDEMDGFDYEVTVEYTEGYRNCSASYGLMSDVSGSKVIGRMTGSQRPFANWRTWIPSESSGFSVNSGATMLPLYDWAMTTLPTIFPEMTEGIATFEAIQNQYDVHFKADFLDAFTGESASISFPGAPTPFGPGSESVTFMRCTKPERIQELIHRGMNALNEIPQVQAQGISLKPVEGMEGFEQLSANFLAMAGGLSPVMGFRDGWMIIGTHKQAVEKALATQAGEGDLWADSDRFKSFGLEVPETVSAISYVNVGENVKAAAAALQQAGMMAPVFLGMAEAQVKDPDSDDAKGLKVVKELAAMLPSIGRIVGKFDFIDATLTTSVPVSEPGAYRKDTVTLIKPPKPQKAPATSSDAKKR